MVEGDELGAWNNPKECSFHPQGSRKVAATGGRLGVGAIRSDDHQPCIHLSFRHGLDKEVNPLVGIETSHIEDRSSAPLPQSRNGNAARKLGWVHPLWDHNYTIALHSPCLERFAFPLCNRHDAIEVTDSPGEP